MRRLLLIFAAFLTVSFASAAQQTQREENRDSLLLDRLSYILLSLEDESITVNQEMSDFFIESCGDSATRSSVALYLYNHYVQSPLMGVEAVAIHIFDNWYQNGKVHFPDEEDFYLAKLYAAANRGTLLGCEAPPLHLKDSQGNTVNVTEPSARLKVLFFYDIDCSRCRMYTLMLENILMDDDPDIDFYAVYVGNDSSRREAFLEEHFREEEGARAHVQNLWDPDGESSFALEYGVLQTPKLFLLDETGRVVGRSLTPQALETMLGLPLTRLSPVGSELPDVKFSGRMMKFRCGKLRTREVSTRFCKIRSAILFFYDEDCGSCRQAMEQVPEYLKNNRSKRVLMVEAAPEFVKYFDLSVLPMLLELDSKGRVSDKYLTIFNR